MEGKTSGFVSRNALVAAVLAAIVALALMLPASAYADTLKAADIGEADGALNTQALTTAAATKTVKKQEFTTSTKVIKKKATAVKTGTNKLNFKAGQGYLKFTAKKTKKYSFTFSNMTSTSPSTAFVQVQTQNKPDKTYSFLTKVSTKGGKAETLWLATKGISLNAVKTVDKPLTKRTGTIKLKKGQDIYFGFFGAYAKAKVTLKIK